VRDFVLIDPDVIEETNLNRVVGAREEDLNRSKVEIAADYIDRFAPGAKVTQIKDDVVHTRIARTLTEVDFIFGCTDSHGSRAIIQQVSYQYHIPCIDMGSTITADHGNVTNVFGRVQLLSPGQACLLCSGLLDSEAVRRDMMSPFERTLDPYITGETIAAPSVISINGIVSSLAVTMFMAVTTGIPNRGRYLLYNGLKSTIRDVRTVPVQDCYICSKSGTLGKADSLPLYSRED
jgi:molybdopterin/thiamine biosynthesis adenylyltransferase